MLKLLQILSLSCCLLFFCAVVVSAANQNILANPDFEFIQDGKPLKWTHDTVSAEHGYDGRAGRLVNPGRVVRALQDELGPGLVTWYGAKLELECSLALFSPVGTARVLLYFESIPDKYCTASRVHVPQGKWMRLRMRFPVTANPLKRPHVGLALESGQEVLLDCAYFGPAFSAPVLPGETIDDFLPGESTHPGTKWSLSDMPSTGNLLLNPVLLERSPDGRPRHWCTDEATAEFTVDREFRLAPSSDGGKPWCYEAPATSISGKAAGTPLCFSVQMTTHGNPSAHFALEAEFVNGGKVVAHNASGAQSIYVGWEERNLYFHTPKEPFDTIRLFVRPLNPGRFTFGKPLLVQREKPQESVEWKKEAENYARVMDFPSRNTYFVGKEPKSLRIQAYLPAPNLKLTLREIEGKTLQKMTWENLPINAIFERELVLPSLQEGAYELLLESSLMSDSELFRIRQPQKKGVSFDANNWMILDGKPFFPIGLNHIPLDDADFFRACRYAGINTVAFYYFFMENDFLFERIRQCLLENDLASVHWNTFSGDGRSAADIQRDFDADAQKLASLPKFIGFLDDETSIHTKGNFRRTRASTSLFFRAFPDYILWENHAPRIHFQEDSSAGAYFPIVRRYSTPMDVLGVDIYPVPAPGVAQNDLKNRSLSCVGDYAELAAATGWNRKPVWMILQGWGWGESGGANNLDKMPRPTYHELRFMTYDAILHGATGIDWHTEGGKRGHSVCDEPESEYWSVFAFVNLELAHVGRRLAGSIPKGVLKTESSFLRCSLWENNGEKILIVANESPLGEATFKNPLQESLFISPTGEKVSPGQAFLMKPYDVVILASTPISVQKPPLFVRRDDGRPPLWTKEKKTIAADWVRTGKRTTGSEFLRIPCQLDKAPSAATLQIAGTSSWRLSINGAHVARGGDFFICYELSVDKYLHAGQNEIVVEIPWRAGREKGCVLLIQDKDGKVLAKTDGQAQWSPDGKGNWQPAANCGPHGPDNTAREARGTSYIIKE